MNQNKPKPKDVRSAKLSVDQYMDIQNAHDEALSASLNGIGGKHAILVAALKRVGILAMSWQEAEKLAQDILSNGYSHEQPEAVMTEVVPQKGSIIKMPSGCGVILDIYRNETGEAIIKILYAKNIVKLQDPELLPMQLANELGLVLSDEITFYADLEVNRQWYQRQFDARFDLIKIALAK